MKRLLAALLVCGFVLSQEAQPERIGDFTVEVRSDLMTDEDRSAIVSADTLSSRSQAALTMRCRGTRLEILVVADELIDRDAGSSIFVRVDAGVPSVFTGSRSTNGRALFLGQGDLSRLIELLQRANKATVRLGDIRLESYTYRFGTTGLKDALAKLKCYKP